MKDKHKMKITGSELALVWHQTYALTNQITKLAIECNALEAKGKSYVAVERRAHELMKKRDKMINETAHRQALLHFDEKKIGFTKEEFIRVRKQKAKFWHKWCKTAWQMTMITKTMSGELPNLEQLAKRN